MDEREVASVERELVRRFEGELERIPVRPLETYLTGARRRTRMTRLVSVATTTLVAVLVVSAALGAGRLLATLREQGPASPAPETTTLPQAVAPMPVLVYFAREGLPPVAVAVVGHAGGPQTTAEQRIGDRISALWEAQPKDAPAGARNVFGSTSAGTRRSLGTSIRTDGDLASIDLKFEPAPVVADASDAQAIVQQLVYTATEEPGIRRVRLTMDDGRQMVLGGVPVETKPLTRDDVSGYRQLGAIGPFSVDGVSVPAQLSTSYSVDIVTPGVARFVITVEPTRSAPTHVAPQFSVTAYDDSHMPGAKTELEITVPNGSDSTTTAVQVDRSPLRSIAVGKPNTFPAQVYRLGLDDQRPWRALVLFDPTRIVIDIGGAPEAISDDQNMVVHAATPNAADRTLTVTGVARAPEATLAFRLKDIRENVVVSGLGKTSVGTSALWGSYELGIPIPAAAGRFTLEVYLRRPDGSEASMVRIPLRTS